MSFATLCVEARNQHDYGQAIKGYFTRFCCLTRAGVTPLMEEREARRFIALVDEFYERHVNWWSAPPRYMKFIGGGSSLNFSAVCHACTGAAGAELPQAGAYAVSRTSAALALCGIISVQPPRPR